MNKFNIANNYCTCLYGFKVPKGAIYGKDNRGIWICIDLAPHNERYNIYRISEADILVCKKIHKRPLKAEEEKYKINLWKSVSTSTASIIGKGIKNIIEKYNPEIVPLSLINSHKNNEIIFPSRRPDYKGRRNSIPVGLCSGITLTGGESFWR